MIRPFVIIQKIDRQAVAGRFLAAYRKLSQTYHRYILAFSHIIIRHGGVAEPNMRFAEDKRASMLATRFAW